MQYGILTFKDPVPDISRKILHVDMDAFYASIEMRDDPSLINKPVVIAHHPRETGGKGIVSTCNYEARKYGIHSAMSALEAFKLCPHAVFIPGNRSYYRDVSQEIHQIFNSYTDLVEPLSLDEAYLDITKQKEDNISSLQTAREIQIRIKNQIGLSCSIGVSYNKFLAKIASDYHKPYGITVVRPEEAIDFLHQLSIEDFYGVGRKSLPHFESLGIRTGADLAAYSLEELITEFGKMGHSLYYKVRGIHNVPVKKYRERKSIGKETTFRVFLMSEEAVLKNIKDLTSKVADKLKGKGLLCQTLTLKIRYDDFQTITRQIHLETPVDNKEYLLRQAYQLWEKHGHLDQDIRLLGISVSSFIDPKNQPQAIKLLL
ncbi:DNA polymerase IV [Facklamia sp. DSM 111018]|uniref:DNA polymerase IV n=1 Tax=Facklamia lactis TaxID=2749967 RepID=A0ABS0LP04_9LACT|nr:DNA polymerase IV [Facklamia lactis]MBG9980079.1 DNA polymerase IV [Facklamia lactis]MBG9985881.1 DNA polymerase IV [Facklamia lactis]